MVAFLATSWVGDIVIGSSGVPCWGGRLGTWQGAGKRQVCSFQS